MAISLTSPIIGSTNWGTSVNLNWTTIASAFSSLAPFTGVVTIAPAAVSSGVQTALTLTGAANTGVTASTEANDVYVNLSRTVTWASSTPTTQRAIYIQAPTYACNTASQTIVTASTVSISGAPSAGTNVSITNAYALNVESGNVHIAGVLSIGTYSITAAGAGLGWRTSYASGAYAAFQTDNGLVSDQTALINAGSIDKTLYVYGSGAASFHMTLVDGCPLI